ncbi:MAG: radical SAM protein [Candidatus ainarchaeum sp.]|nr:radical SAM protein [Candidatus ainarchaeum sp.]
MRNLQLNINEIFCSRQGEGTQTGELTTFIRLSGCNLNCAWCDTKYAKKGKKINVNEIIKEVKKYPANNISITGGEPLIQKDAIILLTKKLLNEKYKISLETNGSLDWKGISKKISISMDIKTPSSKTFKNNFNLIKKLTKNDQLKFVIKNKKDYQFMEEIINKYVPEKNTIVIIQPAWGTDLKKIWSWAEKDNRFRLMVQLHKIVWKEKRGV